MAENWGKHFHYIFTFFLSFQYKYNKADISGRQDIFAGNTGGYHDTGPGLFEYEAAAGNRGPGSDLMIEAQAAGGPVRDYMDLMAGGGWSWRQRGMQLVVGLPVLVMWLV